MQDYSPPTGANGKARAGIPTYPVTLLWYLRIRQDSDSWSLSSFSCAIAEESLLPAKGSSPGFQRYLSPPRGSYSRGGSASGSPPPRGLLHQRQNGKAKEAHKGQISQAIPRNERDNGELSRPEAAPASSRSTQEGTHEGTRKGLRRAPASQCARVSQKRAIRIAAIASVHVNCTAQSRVTLIHCIAHQLLVNLVAGAVLAMFAPPGQGGVGPSVRLGPPHLSVTLPHRRDGRNSPKILVGTVAGIDDQYSQTKSRMANELI
jgi:hypothetical protein